MVVREIKVHSYGATDVAALNNSKTLSGIRVCTLAFHKRIYSSFQVVRRTRNYTITRGPPRRSTVAVIIFSFLRSTTSKQFSAQATMIKSSAAKFPKEFLDDFSGHIQTDAYAGYNFIGKRNVEHVGCTAHARRKFIEAENNDRKRSEAMIVMLAELYGIEKEARQAKMSNNERHALRHGRRTQCCRK
jgi:hypothetical protein